MLKTVLRNTGLAGALAFGSAAAHAQFNIGGGLAASQYGSVGFYPAAQVRIGYDLKEGKSGVVVGFNYSPSTAKENFDVLYRNADFTQTANVKFTEKISINNYFVHTYYRFGDPGANFRFGILAGASVDYITIKYDRGTGPAGLTSSASTDAFDDFRTSGPKVDFGLSGDLRLGGAGMLYTELLTGLPANQVNDNYIVNPTVIHGSFQIGYKLYFGSSSSGGGGGGRGAQRVPTVRF